MTNHFKVLLVEDHVSFAEVLRRRFSQLADPTFTVEHTERLRPALDRLAHAGIDAVLLDLSLPDSRGLDTLTRVRAQAPEVPVVVLTGLDDERLGLEAVRSGAQDYLVKGEADFKIISRILRHAIERQRMQLELRSLSLTDALTGLHNRRGFTALAEQQLKLARRSKRGLLLIYLDLDGLKQLNDRLGHPQGDRALVDLAGLLRLTFRDSDVIARMGGDEFAVLAIEAHEDTSRLPLTRFEENLKRYNARKDHPYRLSVSWGVASFSADAPSSLDDLVARADQAMYRAKLSRQTQ